MFYINQSQIMFDVCVMTYIWCACSLCYFLLSYSLISMPGDIYINSYASAVAEAIACVAGGILYNALKAKKTFVLSFAFSLLGSLLIILFGT